jgi:hypothetical protein
MGWNPVLPPCGGSSTPRQPSIAAATLRGGACPATSCERSGSGASDDRLHCEGEPACVQSARRAAGVHDRADDIQEELRIGVRWQLTALDGACGTESQPYLPQVATRAIFIFKHEKAGFVALICVGMVEVSTCVIRPGFEVPMGGAPLAITRGTEIGHFEFGGSTHMMLFQKDLVVLEDWAIHARRHRHQKNPTAMGSVIATVLPR